MREEGYYWCLYYGEWDIFYWNSQYKSFISIGDMIFKDEEFTEIDERQIKREEL